METKKRKIPTSYWVIAVLALLWNLIGVGMYLSDMFISAEDIAVMEPGLQELYLNRSMFQNIVYGLGVVGGLIGSIGLLLRKPMAMLFFLISLVGVILQFAYGIAFTNAHEVLGMTAFIMPAVVILVAAFLFWHSRNCVAHGMI